MKRRREIVGLCVLIEVLIGFTAFCAVVEYYRNYGPIRGVFLEPDFACVIAIDNDGNAIPNQRFAYWPNSGPGGTYDNEWTIKNIGPYLEGGQTVELLFFAEGYVPNKITSGATGGEWLQISLVPEATISGQITAAGTGSPLEDAYVLAAKEVIDAWDIYLGVTDASGQYEIKMMEEGQYDILASYPDYNFPIITGISLSEGQDLTNFNIAGEGGKIEGTVLTYNGSPIEGAHVILSGPTDFAVATDSSGQYEFVGLGTGTYTVEALLPGGMTDTSIIETNVSVTEGQTTIVNLVAGGGTISGTIQTTSQQPIEGVKVTAIMVNTFYMSEAFTNSGGTYSINNLQPGTYLVTVNPGNRNYVASRRGGVQVTNGNTSTVDFELGLEGMIQGRVTNDSGNPILGAMVSAVDPSQWTSIDDVWATPAITDADGYYTIRHLRESSNYAVCVKAENFVSDSTINVNAVTGQTTTDIDFSLGTSGGAISGTVYESDGQTPVLNTIVAIVVDGESWGMAITGLDGTYCLSQLQAGTYQVCALADGFLSQTLSNIVVTVPNENSGNDFTLMSE
jgi:hypothetical protein